MRIIKDYLQNLRRGFVCSPSGLTSALMIPAFLILGRAPSALAQDSTDNVNIQSIFYEQTTKMYKDIYGYVDAEGREYALLTQVHGVHIVDVTDPENPVKIDWIDAPESNWIDVKTYKHYMYIIKDQSGQGIQIVDLSGLPESVRELTPYTGNGFRASHNMLIDTARGILYATGNAGRDTYVLSLENPERPVQLDYINYEAHDYNVRGDSLFILEGFHNSWSIYDTSDSTDLRLIVRVPIPEDGLAHNGWLTEDGNYFVTTQEEATATVKMWDIRDLDNVHVVDEYLANPGPESIAHNAYIKGDRLYISHYGQGFRVLDISDPTNMVEIAHYRPNYPTSPDLFFGSWGAYVFFPSGNIITSHVRFGMYVLTVDEDPVRVDPGAFPTLLRGLSIVSVFEDRISVYLPQEGPYSIEGITLKGQRLFSLSSEGVAGRQIVDLSLRRSAGPMVWKLQHGGRTVTRQWTP